MLMFAWLDNFFQTGLHQPVSPYIYHLALTACKNSLWVFTCQSGKRSFLGKFLRKLKLQKYCERWNFEGLVRMTFGLVFHSYSLPEGQTQTLVFFAPWTWSWTFLANWEHRRKRFYSFCRQIEERLHNGLTHWSTSYSAVLTILVRKYDDTRRFCVDYQKLNSITSKGAYLLIRVPNSLWQRWI